ncbi:alpha-amylase family glycosyl hydrolase [Mycoplasmopsis edwardii]|uniref:Alpha-amylase family glycosyl hydrolase n=1 Tax=Mycoplasmopsis edwardii TaxID=53558 RepID=A0ACD4PHD1_9BACT|nr:alpha-amylase family glycosyl hydrolase [Mycoplasmopsis edwardii]WBP84074.1 alpha-amylase family glycosyl hydrolase [Mycoplasmopsis edwardii]
MKKFIKLLLASPIAALPIVSAVSCSSEKPFNKEEELSKLQKKELKNWSDKKFVKIIREKNLTNLTYQDDLENVKSIAPFNKEAKRSNVMYQLTVYSFADGNNDGIGDFIGLKNNLDYFVNLGIDTLYLSPFHPASSYHGYDVIDYTDVAPELGGMEAFDAFLIEAHKKGIRVVMDIVINHTSYEHPWFQKALQGDPKYMNYYYMYENRGQNFNKEGRDDVRRIFRITNDTENSLNNPADTNKRWAAEFWSGMPDLNLTNPEVIQEIENMHRFWAKKGVDGFRYDAFYHIFDSGNPIKGNRNKGNERDLFARFRKGMNEEYKNAEAQGISRSSQDAFMFGEWWGSSSDGYARNNWFSKDGRDVALSSLIDGSKWKQNTFVYISNHDELELIKNLTDKNGRKREWIPFLDNHDIDRWINVYRASKNDNDINENPHKLSDSERAAYEYALVSLLSRGGLPTLYNGNEILMQGAPKTKDVNVREAFWWRDSSKNVYFREEKGPDDIITTKASTGEGTVESIVANPNSSYNMLSKIISLRKEFESMREMDLRFVVNTEEIVKYEGIRNNFFDAEMTVRKNDDGTYLLILYSQRDNKNQTLKLKEGFKVSKKLFEKNLKVENNKIIGNGTGKIAAYLITKG